MDQLFSHKKDNFYQAGLWHYWQSYGKTIENQDQFKGYILFADPYHAGLDKINFRLGTDCSRFVYRMFQIMGVKYPFMKTRHFITLAKTLKKKQEFLIQDQSLTDCETRYVEDSFALIVDIDNIKVGDLIVKSKKQGRYGEHGHIKIVLDATKNLVVHAKNRAEGIVIERYDRIALKKDNVFILRWKKPINYNFVGWDKFERTVYPYRAYKCL